MCPLISVIIPTFNRKQLVLEAIASVLVQKPKNYEIIVVDDGSTDGTVTFLEKQHLPITIVSKTHGGVSSARNVGIKMAKGNYIAFLDSDDLWMEGILKAQSSFLEAHPKTPIVYVDQKIVLKGKPSNVTRFTMKRFTHKEMTTYDLPGFAQSPPIHISSVMARKSLFGEIGYFNEELTIHEDTDMWNRISEKYTFGYITKPLSVFRWEEDVHHLLQASERRAFMSEGRKYMKLYEQRRKGKNMTKRVRDAIRESYHRMDQLDKLVRQREQGKITEEEFDRKRQDIANGKKKGV